MNSIINSWVLISIFVFFICSNKPDNRLPFREGFDKFIVGYMKVLFLPLLLIIIPIGFYYERNKLKWFRKNWFCISIKFTIDFTFGWKRMK